MKKLIFAIFVLINISTAQPPQFAPPTISFQGILKDTTGNLIADGTYNMTFEIWRLFQGNQEMLWQEIKDVQVVDGLVTTVLGDVAPIIGFPPQGEKVLRIQLGDEILGQHPFTSVPFALYTNLASFSQRSGQSAISDTSLYTLQVPGSIISSLDSLFNLTDSLYSLYEIQPDTIFSFVYDTLVIRDSLYIFTFDTVYLTYPELPPYPPTMVNVSMSGDDILLSWSSSVSENVDSYAIYKNNIYITSVDSSVYSYTTNNYEYNEDICFYIKAVSATGLQSNVSQEACITTLDNPNLLDIQLINNSTNSIKIYQTTTTEDDLILETSDVMGLFIYYDVLESGVYIIESQYCNCFNYSQVINTNVIITHGAGQSAPYYYTIEEWTQ